MYEIRMVDRCAVLCKSFILSIENILGYISISSFYSQPDPLQMAYAHKLQVNGSNTVCDYTCMLDLLFA